MRTATITFHAPNNNGSFLQAYALQKVLTERIGVSNEIIDFRSDKQTEQYSLFRTPHCVADVAKNAISLMHWRKMKKRYDRFELMRKAHLKMSNTHNMVCDAMTVANGYDVVIAGSDQIWNVEAPDFSNAYMLPSVDKKKIAYSISCGSDAAASNLNKYKGVIQKFDSISVREETVKKQLSGVYDKDIQVTLDPTLLLDERDYRLLYSEKPIVDGDYIFFYSINYSDDALRAVKKMSTELNLPVIAIFTSFHTIKCEKYGIKVLYDGCPADFLNLIKNAKVVATNSFHGTALSIIFHKSFYHLCDVKDGTEQRDDRIDGLLDKLELGDRNYSVISGKMTDILPPDYVVADVKRKEMGGESIEYLKTALGV